MYSPQQPGAPDLYTPGLSDWSLVFVELYVEGIFVYAFGTIYCRHEEEAARQEEAARLRLEEEERQREEEDQARQEAQR